MNNTCFNPNIRKKEKIYTDMRGIYTCVQVKQYKLEKARKKEEKTAARKKKREEDKNFREFNRELRKNLGK